MKTTQSSGTRPVHQTVASGWEFKSGGQTIAIEFSDQRLSPHAGSGTFWGWLRHRVRDADEGRVGKRLLDGPGWRYYSGRADCENGIKELRAGFALPALCLASFWATEAALVVQPPVEAATAAHPDACCAAVRGITTRLPICSRPTATTINLAIATTTTGFGWW